MTLNFEDLTIGQLRKMTQDYERLERENRLLKVKYPNAWVDKSFGPESESAEKIVERLHREVKKQIQR